MSETGASGYSLRPLEVTDYEPIIAVVDDWWGGRSMTAMLPKLFFTHFRTTSWVAQADTAEGNSEIAGFVCGFFSPAEPDVAYIHFVGVDPATRGSGVGALLYDRFEAVAREHGRTTLKAVTSPLNAGSRAFHAARGFAEDAIVADYDGRGEARVLLTKQLAKPN